VRKKMLGLTHHAELLEFTKELPMKTIVVRGEPYLERYFVSETRTGRQIWLHRFLRNDSEEHLHSHPWVALSKVLVGSLEEETEEGKKVFNSSNPYNVISFSKIHRVSAVEPNTWTLMQVESLRLDTWHFIENDGSKTIIKASPRNWFESCGFRK
jgi:hypothetical protein